MDKEDLLGSVRDNIARTATDLKRIRVPCTYLEENLVRSLLESNDWLADATKGHI